MEAGGVKVRKYSLMIMIFLCLSQGGQEEEFLPQQFHSLSGFRKPMEGVCAQALGIKVSFIKERPKANNLLMRLQCCL